MLTEKQINLLPERIAKRLSDVNTKFLEIAGNRIKEIGKLSPSDAQRLTRMVDFGSDMDEIVKKLSQISAKNTSEIYEIFDIVAKDNDRFAEKCCAAQGIPFQGHKENEKIKKWVQSLAAQTAKSYHNLTQNIAFMVIGKDGRKHLTPLAKAYRDIMDKAVLAVTTGVSDYQAEMRHALRQLADSGLRVKYTPLKGKAGKTVDYASGYSRRLDTAIRQNILWGVKECNLGMQEKYGEEFGANGYEISYHSNPRPSHADMGGRQYVIGKGRRIKGKYYPSFSTVEGLLADYGCLHFKFPIICGVSEPTYDAGELKKMKKADKKTIVFEGKEYTRYEASQLQRKIETSVRHAKDRQIIAKAAGDEELRRQEQEKINLLTSKYDKLSKASGLPTRKERMTVSGYRKVTTLRELKNVNGNDIIKKEIEKGNIKIEINPQKQARHIKGAKEYVKGKSYLVITMEQARKIINEKHGTGELVFDRKGNWKYKELIDCDMEIGVVVDLKTKEEIRTSKGTIHYSKTGTHLVPRKDSKNG